ncbi:CBS domain protein [Planktotalea frisia]|jgi:dTDP-glucose pyrophosphorylase|uniref:D-glycero-alpha-D-manno-heptose 1-phosphate guanylyltransferase n=1 Tax=Planktotalea frisia TaxID=696762 RepID=A0A1L9NTA9_9RHOB|nr:nucleotidyltransferase family protein [Planktotalea frisia]OJI92461.1 D-glycero-alpha-D-manno-heptose 1-phosphate guanylyltransferase [Planktotalea frisia]PZX23543.1 CBS domain protein [Planktotalea frisia]
MKLAKYIGSELRALCVHKEQTILEAMQMMTSAGLRLVPVISTSDNTFEGVIADGDIRRFLSSGGQVNANVDVALNRSPVVLETDLSDSDARALMVRRGVEYLPFVQNARLESMFALWVAPGPEDLTAVIMAGGLGSRLAPLTDTCPKPLLPLGGKPILSHIIENLRDQGINRFVLSTNYLSEMIVDHYGDGSALDVSISYVHEKTRMGTGGALGLVDSGQLSEPFLCLNGDILNDIDVDALRTQHQSNNWDATMVVRDFSMTVPYGVVSVAEDEAFEDAEEKPTTHFRINAGCYMLSKSILNVVPKDQFYDLPTLFTDLQKRGMKGGTYMHKGRWIDIGDIAELKRARAIFEGPSS